MYEDLKNYLMVLQNITLISFGYFEEHFLKDIAASVRNEYHFMVRLKEGHLDLSEFYDPTRRQYNGTRLLKEVESLYADESQKTIGLFEMPFQNYTSWKYSFWNVFLSQTVLLLYFPVIILLVAAYLFL